MRKGYYPGGKKAFIYSEVVWNGGASNRKVDELWDRERREKEGEMRKMNKRGRGRR